VPVGGTKLEPILLERHRRPAGLTVDGGLVHRALLRVSVYPMPGTDPGFTTRIELEPP
jgi:hypothetical protein